MKREGSLPICRSNVVCQEETFQQIRLLKTEEPCHKKINALEGSSEYINTKWKHLYQPDLMKTFKRRHQFLEEHIQQPSTSERKLNENC